MQDTNKIIIFNLILIFCLTAFLKVKAAETQTALSLQISSGALSVTAPTSATFAAKSFSFDGQTSTGNAIGTIQTADERGSRAGWSINVTATDWKDSGDASKTLKYNGDGTREGQLSLDVPTLAEINSLAGDPATGLTVGTDANFSTNSILGVVSAAPGTGSGKYTISGLKAGQFIPAGQPTGSYVTNLTVTVS
jgi:hypothetical protein